MSVSPRADPLQPQPLPQSLINPADVNYADCECETGTFGRVPYCSPIPVLATVAPYSDPSSQGIPLFAYNIGASDLTNGTITSSNGVMSVPHDSYPEAITDLWYGQKRYSLGFTTTYNIDLRSLRRPYPLDRAVDETNHERTSAKFIDGMATLQPVRVISLRLTIERSNFSAEGTSLTVFSGLDGDADGLLLKTIDSNLLLCQPTASWKTAIYSSTYASELSAIRNPCYYDITVPTNSALIMFTTRLASGANFLATYDYGVYMHRRQRIARGQ